MAGDQRTLRVVIVGNASQAQRALRDLGRDADNLGRRAGGLGGVFGGLGSRLAAFGATAAAGFGMAAGAAAVWGIKTASNMEQAQIAFTTMLGSAKKATDFLAQLKNFAIKTPFATEDVIKYSQSLMAMGFSAKDVIPILTHAGDAVAGLGGSPEKLQRVLLAIGQIKAKGKVMAGEMLQLTENGIAGWQMIADHLHKTVPEVMKMSEKGAISADTAIAGLMSGMDKRFGGMMKNQSTTVAGMWSTLKDTAQLALGDMMKAFFPLIKGVLPKITSGAQAFSKAAVPAFQRIGAAVGPVVAALKAGFQGNVMPVLQQVGTFVRTSIIPAFQQIAANAIPIFGMIGGFIRGSLIPLFKDLIRIALPVWQTIATTVSGTVMPALRNLVATVMPYFQQFVSFLRTQIVPVLQGMFKQAQPVIQKFGAVLSTVFQGIGVAVKVLAPILAFLWKFLGPIVISTLQGLWSGILGVITGALDVIQGVVNVFIGIFTGNWSKAWGGIKSIFVGIWEFIVGAFKVYIFGRVFSILRGGLAKIAGLWRAGWTGIRAVFTGIVNFIKGGVSGWVGGIGRIISGGISRVRSVWSGGWSAIRTTVSEYGGRILSYVRGLPGKISGFFRGLPGKLAEIGKNIIQGLIRGIKGAWGAVTGVVSSLVDKIPGPIRKMLGIHSPSRVMAEIGKFITQGLVVGMLKGSKGVERTAKRLHELITKAFKAGKISKSHAKSLHDYLHKEDTKLYHLAKQREKIADQLKRAQDKLDGLKKAKKDMASNVASKARDYASFMGAYDSTEFADNSASAMLARLKKKLHGIINFRKNLQTLSKRGFGRGIIAQIAGAGPDEGGQMAEALLNANAGQIKDFNSTYNAINDQSSKLGKFVSGNYYDAGIHAAQGLVKGLKKKESAITKAIKHIAEQMVKTLKKQLGIKSPSRVFMGLGGFTTAGFAKGIRSGHGDVQRAVDELAGTRPSGRLARRSLAHSAAFRAAVAGGPAPNVYVTVQGNVTAEKNLAKAIAVTVRDEIVRNGKRNGGRTGL
ncbi:tape measure protein [Streptomyces sp. NPDC085866]|uniref:tape measure protein n=1 Tax=Streptomyces sp. NPDC085866 TaxID=3365736 RepID=UPI0037D4FB5C